MCVTGRNKTTNCYLYGSVLFTQTRCNTDYWIGLQGGGRELQRDAKQSQRGTQWLQGDANQPEPHGKQHLFALRRSKWLQKDKKLSWRHAKHLGEMINHHKWCMRTTKRCKMWRNQCTTPQHKTKRSEKARETPQNETQPTDGRFKMSKRHSF